MKKRLSEDVWQPRIFIFLVLALMVILSYCLRTTMLSGIFGIVSADLPVQSIPLEDPSRHDFKEEPSAWLERSTPLVILSETAFYFGEFEAFTSKFLDVRNKFIIKHEDGAPNISKLLTTMALWEDDRREQAKRVLGSEVVVLLPTDDMPMPIVLQVMAGLKASPRYKRIVLADGLL